MAKWKVVGPNPVRDVPSGKTFEAEESPQIAALVAGGHIAEVRGRSPKKDPDEGKNDASKPESGSTPEREEKN